MITKPHTPTVTFFTLGCRLNQSETAVLQNRFDAEGFKVVGTDGPSDIAVINTCTVTENGDADTRRLVNRLARRNPGVMIALVGCQAQVQREKLAGLSNVRWVVGNARKMDLSEIISLDDNPLSTQVITPAIDKKSFVQPASAADRLHTRVNLKIQDGCDFFCSFCEIPYARGRARSRVFSDILREARELAASGHREAVITGINVGTYADDGKSLTDVIDALESIDGLDRVRISSIEPTTIPGGILERMRDTQSKLCRYLHIPLQSGSDPVLRAMKRLYTRDEFDQFIRRAAREVTDICIGTDVIVGFPGETEGDFDAAVDYLRAAPVHYFHVFSYSVRNRAQSRKLGEGLPADVIQQRSRILRSVSQEKRTAFYHGQLGKIEPVLFEKRKHGRWTGVTGNYLRVSVNSGKDLHNTIRPVKLLRVADGVIEGELLNG